MQKRTWKRIALAALGVFVLGVGVLAIHIYVVTRPRVDADTRVMVRIDLRQDIGQADAQFPKLFIILGCEKPRRQADLVQGGPEFVLAMGVIGLLQSRLAARRGAAEHQLQSRSQPVRKDMLADRFLGHQCE